MKLLLCCSALMACGCGAAFADDLGIEGWTQIGSNYIDFSTTLTNTGSYEPAPGYGEFQVTSVGSGSLLATGGVITGETGRPSFKL